MFRHKKMFGQNFITNSNIIKSFLSKVDIKNKNVVEIGTGKGILTRELAKVANKVISFEIDKTLMDFHKGILDENKNLDILYQDFFTYEKPFDNTYVLVSNPPYNLTKEIIFWFLKSPLKEAVLMFQKEVIERLMATPGEKEYGSLTVATDYFCEKVYLATVKKECFTPKPKVDSAVIRFIKRDVLQLNDSDDFLSFVQKIFNQKRKTLLNNLDSSFNIDKEKTKVFLRKTFDDENIRAEKLNLENLIEVYKYAKNI